MASRFVSLGLAVVEVEVVAFSGNDDGDPVVGVEGVVVVVVVVVVVLVVVVDVVVVVVVVVVGGTRFASMTATIFEDELSLA